MGGERQEYEIWSDFCENARPHINRARNREKGTPKLGSGRRVGELLELFFFTKISQNQFWESNR